VQEETIVAARWLDRPATDAQEFEGARLQPVDGAHEHWGLTVL
jgi:hypothetical protein